MKPKLLKQIIVLFIIWGNYTTLTVDVTSPCPLLIWDINSWRYNHTVCIVNPINLEPCNYKGVRPHPVYQNKYYECLNNAQYIQNCSDAPNFDNTRIVSMVFDQDVGGCIHKFECTLPDGYFPFPYNHSKYYRCSNWVDYLMVCPEHQVFDGRQSCIDTFRCPLYDGDFTNPNNRHQYYQCLNSKPYLKTCPSGMYFDDLRRKCMKNVIAFEWCPEHHPGKFKHPSNQNLYYECWEGIAITKSCGDGYYFNEQAQLCTTYNNQFYCPETNGKYADPHNNTRYYRCRNNIPVLLSCPHTYLFDGNKCYQQYKCPKPNGKFVSSNSRHEYYECRNDVPLIEVCPMGQVFDETVGQCVETSSRALKKMVIISGRIEFDDNGVKVVDVWDNGDQWWKRTYDGNPYMPVPRHNHHFIPA